MKNFNIDDFSVQLAQSLGYDPNNPQVKGFIEQKKAQMRSVMPGADDETIANEFMGALAPVAEVMKRTTPDVDTSKFDNMIATFRDNYGTDKFNQAYENYRNRAQQTDLGDRLGSIFSAIDPNAYKIHKGEVEKQRSVDMADTW